MSNSHDSARPTRRALLAVAGATLAAPVTLRRARADAEFTFKFANNVPATHPLNRRLQEAGDRIRHDTSGRFDLQLFPNNQLGSDTDVLSQLRAGGVEMFSLSGLILSTLVPAASINGIGFAFPDYPTVWKAMDGELGAYVRGQIERAGLVAQARVWDNGYREITSSSKAVTGAADLKGMRIRVPVSPLWTSMFQAFGSAPTSINFAEVYSALQTHVVDAEENPLAVIDAAKIYEVQKYCSLTNHMWDGFWILANRRAWNGLPADVRDTVSRHLDASALDQRRDIAALNDSLRTTLAGRGLAMNAPAPDSFREALRKAGFYTEWKAKYGDQAWALLEKATGPLA